MPLWIRSGHPVLARFAATICVVSALAGCRDDGGPTAVIDPPPGLREHVTDVAAQSIDAQGYFRFPAPPPSTTPMMDAERAGILAKAFLRTWGEIFRVPLERDRGGRIDFSQLQVGRVFFAQTPFGPVPDGFHPFYRNRYGPYYLVTMVAGREPVLIIAVAAHATDEQIDERGYLKPKVRTGGEFSPRAVALGPRVGAGYQPNFPEQAAERVGRITGARVTHVPELLLRADPDPPDDAYARFWSPSQALWRVQLDRDVDVTAAAPAGRRARVRELYVGPFDRLLIPAENQLTVQRFEARLLGDSASFGGVGILEVPIYRPIAYQVVTLDQPGGR